MGFVNYGKQLAQEQEQEQKRQEWEAQNTGLPYVSEGDKNFASKTMANVSRAEYEDYLTRFAPYEQKLIAQIDNGAAVDTMIGQANTAVDQGMAQGLADIQRTQAKYGTTSDATQQQAGQRSMALSGAATKAGLANTVRTHARDRDMQIMSGTNVGAMKGLAEADQ